MTANRSDAEFVGLVEAAVAQSVTGWDFAFLRERMIESDTSWDFHDLVSQKTSAAAAMLDMHTGGGEFLDSVPNLPVSTVATEGFAPNLPLARERLEKRGVEVREVVSDAALGGQDGEFDLVVNRHGAFAPQEVRRVLRDSGAVFLTQQVGSMNLTGLNEALGVGVPDTVSWDLDRAIDQLESVGFAIAVGEEEFPTTSFRDIGAVVIYLLAVPWQIPEFSVARYREELLGLHEQITSRGSFDTSAHRFLIEARLE